MNIGTFKIKFFILTELKFFEYESRFIEGIVWSGAKNKNILCKSVGLAFDEVCVSNRLSRLSEQTDVTVFLLAGRARLFITLMYCYYFLP